MRPKLALVNYSKCLISIIMLLIMQLIGCTSNNIESPTESKENKQVTGEVFVIDTVRKNTNELNN